jgi:hypothetical protein
MEHQNEGFSPPWCDIIDFYCSLQLISVMSYLPDLYKVRSGPGVSVFRFRDRIWREVTGQMVAQDIRIDSGLRKRI